MLTLTRRAEPRLRRRRLATTIVTQIATSRGDARAFAPRKAERALLDVGGRLCDLSQAEWVCALEVGLLQQVLASIFDGGFCSSADSAVYQWKDTPHSYFYSMVSDLEIYVADLPVIVDFAVFVEIRLRHLTSV